MNYWKQRKQQLEKQLERDEKQLKIKLNKVYNSELSKLEKEISLYYQKYGKDNVIEYRTLLQRLSESDIKMLMERMEEFATKYPQYKHLLPVRESIYKLNRLEGLQQSIILQQYEIGAIEESALREHLTKFATLNANNTAEMLGFGKNFYFYNSSVISSLVNERWCDNKNFSDRIWNNRQKLANFLNKEFAQAIARGDSYDRIAKSMKQKFDKVSKNDMYRLIYTEDTYIQAESSIRQFEEMGKERYRISVIKDDRACPICKAKAEQVFKIKDREAGKNFPPFHPWCRCTFTIEENENHDTWLNNLIEERNSKKNKLNEINNSGKIKKEIYRSIKRREKNTGVFSNLQMPMQKRTILNIANQYKIDVTGITFKIQRSEKFLALPFLGSTDYQNIGRIDLFPNAFEDEEQLVKTILHEKCHVNQLKKYGRKYVQENLLYMEKLAYRYEKLYYYILKKGR